MSHFNDGNSSQTRYVTNHPAPMRYPIKSSKAFFTWPIVNFVSQGDVSNLVKITEAVNLSSHRYFMDRVGRYTPSPQVVSLTTSKTESPTTIKRPGKLRPPYQWVPEGLRAKKRYAPNLRKPISIWQVSDLALNTSCRTYSLNTCWSGSPLRILR